MVELRDRQGGEDRSARSEAPRGAQDSLLARLDNVLSLAPDPGKRQETKVPTHDDLAGALDLIKHVPETIDQLQRRQADLEARVNALLVSVGQELRASEARVQAAEERTRAAEARASAAEQRAAHALEWLDRLSGSLGEHFTPVGRD